MGSSISLAMIVKDEADQLAECLAGVQEVFSEICIVDTGSTDHTLEIAKSFGARVSVFIWCDDFAAARNESLRMCTGDWIFVLDANERIDAGDLPTIQALARGPHDSCYRFTTRNYTNNTGISGFQASEKQDPNARGFAGWYPSVKVRFFPNHRGARFEGKVHELVNQSLERQGIRIIDCPVPVHHCPVSKDGERIHKKEEVRLERGHERVAGDAKSPHALAELGNHYAEAGDFVHAAGAYQEALKQDPANARLLNDLGAVLHRLDRPEEAHRALRLALEQDPTLPDAWRSLGVVLADIKQYEGALECFGKAMALDPAWTEGHRYLSMAIEGSGRLSDAAVESRRALEANPRSVECLKLYIHQMLRLERRAEAREVILNLVAADNESPGLHNAVGELYFYDGQFEKAESHFTMAGEGGLASAFNNLGVALFKQGKFEEAKNAFEKCLERDPGHKGAHSNLQKAIDRLSS